MIERLEALAEIDALRQRCAQCRAGAVGANQRRCGALAHCAGFVAKLHCGFVPVDLRQALVEVDARTRRLGGVEQDHVQAAAIDRPDHFTVVAAVAQQFAVAVEMMHHAPAHHHRNRPHALLQAGDAQAVPAAFGEREVYRAAAEEAGLAWIGPAFEDFDGEAALCQQRGEQRANQPGADHGDLSVTHQEIMTDFSRQESAAIRADKMTARQAVLSCHAPLPDDKHQSRCTVYSCDDAPRAAPVQ